MLIVLKSIVLIRNGDHPLMFLTFRTMTYLFNYLFTYPHTYSTFERILTSFCMKLNAILDETCIESR